MCHMDISAVLMISIKLIMDDSVSSIVADIFQFYINGIGICGIARKLNARGIDNSTKHLVDIGMRKLSKSCRVDTYGQWTYANVRNILRCPLYTGDLIQGMSTSYSHKNKKRIDVPQDQWIVTPNTHEAIISREMYELTIELLGKNIKPKSLSTEPSIFAGYLFCADCGKAMVRNIQTKNGKQYKKYWCSTSKKYGRNVCSSHYIDEKVVTEVLLSSIKLKLKMIRDIDDVIGKLGENIITKRKIALIEKEYRSIKNQIENMEYLRDECYSDYKKGLLDEDDYVFMSERYKERRDELQKKLFTVEDSKKDISNVYQHCSQYVRDFMSHKDIRVLSREMIVALVSKILITDDKCIKIIFKFEDQIVKLQSILEQ